MINQSKIFSSFSVNDLTAAKKFYKETLGLKVQDKIQEGCGPMMTISLPQGGEILVYPKKSHVPATFTVLNFGVTNIDKEVEDLTKKGVKFETYDGVDDKGIMHGEGPLVAWFKDPAGNYISVIKEEQLGDTLDVEIKKVFPIKTNELFKFFAEADLLEEWAYPDGFKLKIPKFEPRTSGAYRWEHSSDKGAFISIGHYKDFIPNQKITMVDESITDPSGKVIYENQECTFEFSEHEDGSELVINHKGFKDQKDRNECETSWNQCLSRLDNLLTRTVGGNRLKDKGSLEQLNH